MEWKSSASLCICAVLSCSDDNFSPRSASLCLVSSRFPFSSDVDAAESLALAFPYFALISSALLMRGAAEPPPEPPEAVRNSSARPASGSVPGALAAAAAAAFAVVLDVNIEKPSFDDALSFFAGFPRVVEVVVVVVVVADGGRRTSTSAKSIARSAAVARGGSSSSARCSFTASTAVFALSLRDVAASFAVFVVGIVALSRPREPATSD